MFIWEGCLTLWLRGWAVFSGRVLIRAGVLFNDQAQHIPSFFFLLILIFLIENLTAVGSQPAVVEVPTSSNDSERDTCSPTPLGGSNKLGMSSGWSSTFETEAVVDAVDGSNCNDQADTADPLPSSQERLSPRIPTKTQAPSFGTLLRDYSVQGRKRFEPPVYVDGAVPTQPKQVQSSQVHV